MRAWTIRLAATRHIKPIFLGLSACVAFSATLVTAERSSLEIVQHRASFPELQRTTADSFAEWAVAYTAAMEAGKSELALEISRKMTQAVRAEYGDERGMTPSEFEHTYPITSSFGYEMIRRLQIAHHAEVNALLALGQYPTAVLMFERDLYLGKVLYGDASLYYMDELGKNALMAKVAGEYGLAISWLTEKTRVSRKMLGSNSVVRAQALASLADLLSDVGQVAQAQIRGREALGIIRHLDINTGRDYRQVLAALERAEIALGRTRQAENLTMAILEDLKLRGETASLEYGVYLKRAGRHLEQRGQLDRAEELYLASISNALAATGENSVVYALRVKTLAEMYHNSGQHDVAQVHFRAVAATLTRAGMAQFIGPVGQGHFMQGYGFPDIDPTLNESAETGGGNGQFIDRIQDLIAD